MRTPARPTRELVAAAAAFVLAFVIATELARPFRGGAVSFDSAAAVLYWERLAAGLQLEQFVTTTPKPLLTVVYGALYGATDDWRALSWAAIVAFALGVALFTVVALRIGGVVPAAFTAVGLAGAPQLLLDTGLSLAWPLALLALSVAALALSARAPRYLVAGTALLFATLARLELLVVVGGIAVVLVVARWGPRAVRRPLPGDAWWLLLGFAALPVMGLHDWLLTGDPLHWTRIAGRYSREHADEVRSIIEISDTIIRRYVAVGVMTLLAIFGVASLFRSGRHGAAVALVILGFGVLAFLVLLAARDIFVDDRYFAATDLALVLAAAFGLGALRLGPMWSDIWARSSEVARSTLAVATAAVVAIGTSGGWAFHEGVRTAVREQLAFAIDTRAVLPEMRAFVDAQPQVREFPNGDGEEMPLLLVPVRGRPHMVVDLGLPLGEVGSTDPASVDLAAGYPGPGQLVYHHVHGDRHPAPLEVLRTTTPVVRDGARIVPVAVDEGRGYWVVTIAEP